MAVPTHYIKKRDLLYGLKTPASTLSRVAREYLENELYSDALDFFERAQDRDGFKSIRSIALKNGDTFLIHRIERIDPSLISEEDWENVGQTADGKGMKCMAQFAKRRLDSLKAARGESDKESESEE